MRWALAAVLIAAAGQACACIVLPTTDMPDSIAQATGPQPSDPWENLHGTAWYEGATTAYPHGVLGDAVEATRLRLFTPSVSSAGCASMIAQAGDQHVFEDTKPRVVDLDGDGIHEVIAVRSRFDQGAQLVVYEENPSTNSLTIRAATPYIGQRNRWLAPIGAADLDGDGSIEIAYIDRPHLAKTLRIVSVQGDLLTEEIAGAGFTNHRIGEGDIAGGVRDCGAGPEMIVASGDWTQLVAVTYDGAALAARQIGTDTSRPAFARTMACR